MILLLCFLPPPPRSKPLIFREGRLVCWALTQNGKRTKILLGMYDCHWLRAHVASLHLHPPLQRQQMTPVIRLGARHAYGKLVVHLSTWDRTCFLSRWTGAPVCTMTKAWSHSAHKARQRPGWMEHRMSKAYVATAGWSRLRVEYALDWLYSGQRARTMSSRRWLWMPGPYFEVETPVGTRTDVWWRLSTLNRNYVTWTDIILYSGYLLVHDFLVAYDGMRRTCLELLSAYKLPQWNHSLSQLYPWRGSISSTPPP